jgi:hypothetical protein
MAQTVGCEFRIEAAQPMTAILQVAPGPQPGLGIQSERWQTGADHHSYLDHYGNRCERLALSSGVSEIAYEAKLLLTDPADLVLPDAKETPVTSLPDEVLTFVMPSRFCLPDQLGAEAWERFGDVACRRSSTTFTTTSNSLPAPPTPGPRRLMRTWPVRAYAVTSPTSRSASAER